MFYGLLGLRVYYFYIPLMFVGYVLIGTERDLRRFLLVNSALAVVIALVGIIQSTVSIFFLNPRNLAPEIEGLGHLVRITSSGLRVARPPSVFVSDGRYANYLMVAFTMAFGAAGYLLMRKHRGWGYIFQSLILIVLGAVLGGSRGCVVYIGLTAVVLSAGMLWGTEWDEAQARQLARALRRTVLVVVLAMVLALALFPEEIGKRLTFYSDTLSPQSEHFEAGNRTGAYPLQEFIKAFSRPNWTYGNGIGTISLGLQYVRKIFHVPQLPIGVENGFGQIILELGVAGLFSWLIWTSALIVFAWDVLLRLKKTPLFPVGLSIFWFALILLFPISWTSLGVFQNFVVTAYFWLLVGILWRLPELAVPTPSEANGQVVRAAQTAYRRRLSLSR